VEVIGEPVSPVVRPADAPPTPAKPGPCAVPCTVVGSLPTYSITSISPHAGHPTRSMSWPSSQNAGHTPRPTGGRTDASTYDPGSTTTLFWVVRRALV
jgi:hypothetical protein